MLAGLCITLGVIGAIVLGLDSDTTVPQAWHFGVLEGLVPAGLVWAGYGAAQLERPLST